MISTFDEIKKIYIKNTPNFNRLSNEVLRWGNKLKNQNIDLDDKASSHIKSLFKDGSMYCALLNLKITFTKLTKELTFILDSQNVPIELAVARMFERQHFCLADNFWKIFSTNQSEIQLDEIKTGRSLGVIFIPLAYQAISALLILGAAAGCLLLNKVRNREIERETTSSNPSTIENEVEYQTHQWELDILVYYIWNIVEASKRVSESLENPFLLDIVSSYNARKNQPQRQNIDMIVDTQNSIAIPSDQISIPIFGSIERNSDLWSRFERVNVDNNLERLINQEQRDGLRNLFRNDGVIDSRREESKTQGELIGEIQRRDDLFGREVEALARLRELIRERESSDVPKATFNRYEQYTIEEEEKKEGKDDDGFWWPLLLFPIWINPSSEKAEKSETEYNLKNWFYWGKWSCNVTDYKQDPEDGSSVFPKILFQPQLTWNQYNTAAIFDLRVNKKNRKSIARIYFKEY